MPFVYEIYIAPIIQIAQDTVQGILNQGPLYKTPLKIEMIGEKPWETTCSETKSQPEPMKQFVSIKCFFGPLSLNNDILL